jgi:hypothetical protein
VLCEKPSGFSKKTLFTLKPAAHDATFLAHCNVLESNTNMFDFYYSFARGKQDVCTYATLQVTEHGAMALPHVRRATSCFQ